MAATAVQPGDAFQAVSMAAIQQTDEGATLFAPLPQAQIIRHCEAVSELVHSPQLTGTPVPSLAAYVQQQLDLHTSPALHIKPEENECTAVHMMQTLGAPQPKTDGTGNIREITLCLASLQKKPAAGRTFSPGLCYYSTAGVYMGALPSKGRKRNAALLPCEFVQRTTGGVEAMQAYLARGSRSTPIVRPPLAVVLARSAVTTQSVSRFSGRRPSPSRESVLALSRETASLGTIVVGDYSGSGAALRAEMIAGDPSLTADMFLGDPVKKSSGEGPTLLRIRPSLPRYAAPLLAAAAMLAPSATYQTSSLDQYEFQIGILVSKAFIEAFESAEAALAALGPKLTLPDFPTPPKLISANKPVTNPHSIPEKGEFLLVRAYIEGPAYMQGFQDAYGDSGLQVSVPSSADATRQVTTSIHFPMPAYGYHIHGAGELVLDARDFQTLGGLAGERAIVDAVARRKVHYGLTPANFTEYKETSVYEQKDLDGNTTLCISTEVEVAVLLACDPVGLPVHQPAAVGPSFTAMPALKAVRNELAATRKYRVDPKPVTQSLYQATLDILSPTTPLYVPPPQASADPPPPVIIEMSNPSPKRPADRDNAPADTMKDKQAKYSEGMDIDRQAKRTGIDPYGSFHGAGAQRIPPGFADGGADGGRAARDAKLEQSRLASAAMSTGGPDKEVFVYAPDAAGPDRTAP